MSPGEYFELIIIPVLIGLTMITLFLLFLYTLYGKEERTGPPGTRCFKLRRIISLILLTTS